MADDPAMTEIIARYFAEIDWPDGGTLLEIGCGTGPVVTEGAEAMNATNALGYF